MRSDAPRAVVGGTRRRLRRQTDRARRPIRSFPGKHVLFAVLASMFFHANILHIAGNMFFLWMFGDNVEDRLGRSAYAIFYLVGGVAAAVGHVLSDTGSIVPVVGASGAIAAVMGAYLVQSPKARLTAIVPPLFFLPFRIPAWIFLIEWLVLQFFTSADSGVAWVAHVAGFATGGAGAVAAASRSCGPIGLCPLPELTTTMGPDGHFGEPIG